jgi:hypothetical protein
MTTLPIRSQTAVIDPELIKKLLANAKQALFAAVEIHNKPIFPYRYEVCTLLVINAWELLLKAFIASHLTGVKQKLLIRVTTKGAAEILARTIGRAHLNEIIRSFPFRQISRFPRYRRPQ